MAARKVWLGTRPVTGTLGQVVITIFFWQCDGYSIHCYVFWDADSESDIENFIIRKMTARTIWNFKITMGVQEIKM